MLVGGRAQQVGGVSLLRGRPGPEAACEPSHGYPLARTVLLAVARQRWEARRTVQPWQRLASCWFGSG